MAKQLHIFFLPFMGPGHMIPAIDMAKLFASHGVKVTIVTTPLNVPYLSKTIDNYMEMDIKSIRFPYLEAGLPQGIENTDSLYLHGAQNRMFLNFNKAMSLLQQPFEQLLEETCPDCIVTDMLFPWSVDSATKFGIPRLAFDVSSFISMCVSECLRLYQPQRVSSDSEPFVVPNLPHEIKFTRMQLPEMIRYDGADNVFTKLMNDIKESESRSFGTVVNSFYELESDYIDHYRNFFDIRAWHIGPVSSVSSKGSYRGKEASIECLKWLDSKKPNSVVYISFGSMANFEASRMKELAMGLEASGQQFIWVVSKLATNEEEWLPQGFEERMEGKGLIIRGWAPQVLVLDHEAVGGFVTHCGWNSTLEAITAGVPMATWPVSAEQFYNEKLITQILNIGIAFGVKEWTRNSGDLIDKKTVESIVTKLLVGEEAEEMRKRAKILSEKANKAVKEGGSSYTSLEDLIDELKLARAQSRS